jgi:hypothetical protein
MNERTVEDLVTGVLHIPIGSVVKDMPTLKAKYIDEWGRTFVASEGEPKKLAEWTMQDVAQFSGHTVARLLDLVVAYDRTAALGGREWIAENADPQQLHAALVQMVGNAFPLADAPAVLIGLMITQSAAPSDPPNSTNGSSTTGDSTRTKPGRASIPSS